jgi:phosphoglucosamine mutase
MSSYETCPKIKKAQEETEAKLTADERILVRPSGTEPLIRVMIEGRDKDKITKWAKNLAAVIEESLS